MARRPARPLHITAPPLPARFTSVLTVTLLFPLPLDIKDTAHLVDEMGSSSANSVWRQTAPTVVFALVPVFAVLCGLLFRRRKLAFSAHFVFALTVHAVAFLLLTLSWISEFLPETLSYVFTTGILLGLVAYVAAALRAFYGGGAIAAAWHATLLVVLHMLLIMAVSFIAAMLARIWRSCGCYTVTPRLRTHTRCRRVPPTRPTRWRSTWQSERARECGFLQRARTAEDLTSL